eukprot:scaffold15973_cov137-Isochrysis_galbana.AAC.4
MDGRVRKARWERRAGRYLHSGHGGLLRRTVRAEQAFLGAVLRATRRAGGRVGAGGKFVKANLPDTPRDTCVEGLPVKRMHSALRGRITPESRRADLMPPAGLPQLNVKKTPSCRIGIDITPSIGCWRPKAGRLICAGHCGCIVREKEGRVAALLRQIQSRLGHNHRAGCSAMRRAHWLSELKAKR